MLSPLRFLSVLTVLVLANLPFASAWITGFSAYPTTPLAPGSNFTAVFNTADYIQNNAQYYTLFGAKLSTLPFNTTQEYMGILLGTGMDLVTSVGVS